MFLTVYIDVCGVRGAQKLRKKTQPKLLEAELSWKAVDPNRSVIVFLCLFSVTVCT